MSSLLVCIISAASFRLRILTLRQRKSPLGRIHRRLLLLPFLNLYLTSYTTLKHGGKGILHILISERTRLRKEHPQRRSQLLPLSSRHHLLGILSQVELVSNNDDHHIGRGVLADSFDPFFDVFETLVFCYVVDHQSAQGLAVVA